MTGPASVPVDVAAILGDLQQQMSELTGVVEAQQNALADLTVIVPSQHDARRQLRLDGTLPPAAPSPAPCPAPSVVPSVLAAAGRPGGV